MSYYLVPTAFRTAFLKLAEKLGVSRQSITADQGYYKNLIANKYEPNKISDIQVNFNGTQATMPLGQKRLNYIKRHAHEPKTEVKDGVKILTRSALADIAWAAYPFNISKPSLNKLLNNTLKIYQVGCGCGCQGQNMKFYSV